MYGVFHCSRCVLHNIVESTVAIEYFISNVDINVIMIHMESMFNNTLIKYHVHAMTVDNLTYFAS